MNMLFIRGISLKELPEGEEYLQRLLVVRELRRMGELPLEKPVTFFAGENGTGKSTLLEATAVSWGFNPEGGSRNHSFETRRAYSSLQVRLMKGPLRPADGFFLRAESFYNMASNIDELDEQAANAPKLIDSYGGRSLHKQSHGESFLALALNRFGPKGLYILDEPEAALSPTRQLSLLCRIRELEKLGSQFLIATHSPILMAYPGADIYELSDEGIQKTPYERTENYIVTKEFLNCPQKMLRLLLGE